MDVVWIILGSILMIVGLIGCLLPVLPGPPLNYIGLLLLQLTADSPFSTNFMLLWLAITIGVVALDYVIPVYGTKRFGGSKWGIWGTVIGLILGIFIFPPFGIIIGPIAGALIGELLSGKNSKQAGKAAIGSFIGFLFGTFIKLTASCVMIFYFVQAIF
ncbi:DUF456 domain-containing protein [Fulvivirga sp. RKSG066]|uniref:DUF456 domain-containing protein n=1 Tax=Fulvivirga aurantia TaxID=2529383 RepID=UPI0012BB5D0E|nr:DUF456 domain-containing protein [Fulvivirga aurantia]MTI21661.1 DUF456 domain-containing protein [Fulvivirga aurantia]